MYIAYQTLLVIKSRMRWARHIACMKIINSYRTVLEKYEGKRSLVEHRHRWKDCIKINTTEYKSPG